MWRRKQRLAAGDADLLHAEIDEDASDAFDFLEGQQLLARKEGIVVTENFLGHAIHAAEVAAVGDRDAQVAHAAPAQVEQLTLRQRGEVARRRQAGADDGNDAVGHGRRNYKPHGTGRQLPTRHSRQYGIDRPTHPRDTGCPDRV
jgi:hypothetical protein